LNYRGLAEITSKESFFTNTVARLSGATLKDGKLQFPFRIGGTIDSPLFSKGKGDKDVDAVQKRDGRLESCGRGVVSNRKPTKAASSRCIGKKLNHCLSAH